jgi:hypothetical protein
MEGLKLNRGGQVLVFNPLDMKVYPDGQNTAVGTWRATATGTEAKANGIRFTLQGAAQLLLPIVYAFNDKNQLTATIPAGANGGTASTPFTFEGGIAIDDNDDVVYNLANPNNISPRPRITVYGKLSLSKDATQLEIALNDNGGSTKITADTGNPWLDAIKNPNTALQPGMDMLVFRATTRNAVAGNFPANITFTGLWGIHEGQITFQSKIKADTAGVKASLALQGQVKGVAFGLEVTTEGAGPTVSLLVRGVHKFRSGDASWQIALGFSGKKFVTAANVDVDMTPGAGQSLRITGDLQLTGTPGTGSTVTALPQSLKLQLNLSVVYRVVTANKLIVFRANFAGNTLNLELSGKFTFKNGSLEFALVRQNGTFAASIALNFQTDGLTLALKVITNGTTLELSLNFEVKLVWVNGQLVRKDPRQLTA